MKYSVASFCLMMALAVNAAAGIDTTNKSFSFREPEPKDDRGGKGRGKDDRNPGLVAREAEPGDDRGRGQKPAEPGDDRGRGRGRGRTA